MATTTVTIRKVNTRTTEQPLVVKFRHTSIELVISTGYQVQPSSLKNGRVTGPDARVINGRLDTIQSDLMEAYQHLVEQGLDVTKDSMKSAYEAQKFARENQVQAQASQSQFNYLRVANEVAEPLDAEDEITAELAELERQLVEKRAKLVAEQKKRNKALEKLEKARIPASLAGKETEVETLFRIPAARQRKDITDPADLLVTYIQKFLNEQSNNHQESTKETYRSVISAINLFNPRLRIQDVDRATMYNFQDFLIKRKSLNSTIEKITSQTKSILNYFQHDLGLSLSYKQYRFKLPKLENDILFLSIQQLEDFWNHIDTHPETARRYFNKEMAGWLRMRDQMMFMCGTGLRFSDIFQDFRDFIKINKQGQEIIVLHPQKTRQKQIKVEIILYPLLKGILERHNYKFKPLKDWYFRRLLREYCKDIPSFQQEIVWHEYSGQNKTLVLNSESGEKPKFWELLGAHTGRRTWINFAFQSGWNLPSIMGQSGHTDMKTLSIYASKARVEPGLIPLDFFSRAE